MKASLIKLENYIRLPDLPIHNPNLTVWNPARDIDDLIDIPDGAASTQIRAKRDAITGEIIGSVEYDLEAIGEDETNSTSMLRDISYQKKYLFGNALSFPFWPGGMEAPPDVECKNFLYETELRIIPPHFTRGYEPGQKIRPCDIVKSKVNLLDKLDEEEDVQKWLDLVKEEKEEDGRQSLSEKEFKELQEEVLKVPPDTVLKISAFETNLNSEWVEVVNLVKPKRIYEERIRSPPITFPFELDEFQKQAIILLAEKEYVFVAAHTSAGKTVVAEYAAALSLRNMTRIIYTSPIKALSNQKYRDFKKAFQDVGLVTGDLQLNLTANCLIMTTEILRSMLFSGSDLTRDLEYVIFDEVHYINNPERGHVWEEIIILLPDHVTIIMLSATVPNTLELANWVGSTKKRKVHVISTNKRPVPLNHFLYTYGFGKSKNTKYLVADSDGNFYRENYLLAVDSKPSSRGSGFRGGHQRGGGHQGGGGYQGGGGHSGGGGHQGGGGGHWNRQNFRKEHMMWRHLIKFLKECDEVPVVAFTLSRKRCDMNAIALTGCDMNTPQEKVSVRTFVKNCLSSLSPPDRELPQVISMQDSLERGIGVHHSGILPILKETVELLFQLGLVKVLFATETFAMGVNMPARTVVFDSFHKFDGNETRSIKAGEYIQMAGRAGRRGFDKQGNVILLCKQRVPPEIELRQMILGSPEKLESHFLLRYSVILMCLRIEKIKVEDIILFSFKEFSSLQALPDHIKHLKQAEAEYKSLPPLPDYLKPLNSFYKLGEEYFGERRRLMARIMSRPQIKKILKPGRVLIVSHGRHYNKLGIFLHMKPVVGCSSIYSVLVLDNDEPRANEIDTKIGDVLHKLYSLFPENKIYRPNGCEYAVLELEEGDICEITKSNINVNFEQVLSIWEARKQKGCKNVLLGKATLGAVYDLQVLSDAYILKPKTLDFVALKKFIDPSDDFERHASRYVKHLKQQLTELIPKISTGNFINDLKIIHERQTLEKKIEDLKFKNSKKNLTLYPDYLSKLEVLRALKYIDESNEVTMKGKIACEIGHNELLITELIFCNVFDELNAAESAAMISSLVFQAKVDEEPNLTDRLKKCLKEFQYIDDTISKQEAKYNAIAEVENRLNFGAVEVVYKWAMREPFAEIMKITEVQEGLIVRCVHRLDETLRDIRTAAVRIGNTFLQAKMEEASDAIKRDIVFTESLYTTGKTHFENQEED